MFLLHFLASIHLSNLNFIHRSLCHKLPQIYRRPGVNRELSDQFTDQSRKLSPRRIVGVFSSRIDTIRLAVSPEQRAPSSRSTRACSSPNPGHARASVLFENRAWEKKRGDKKPRDQKKKKRMSYDDKTRKGKSESTRYDNNSRWTKFDDDWWTAMRWVRKERCVSRCVRVGRRIVRPFACL